MKEMTAHELIKNLVLVGYTLSELSKFTGVSRSTLSNILKEESKVSNPVYVKIKNFFNKNIEDVELGKFKDFEFMATSLILTPDGFESPCGFVEKGDLPCYKIKTSSYETIAAEKHLFQKSNEEWINTKDLNIGDELLCENGIEKVISKDYVGEIPCFDITIKHPNHRYYLNGISSHNTGKSLIAATLIANAQKDGCQHVFYFDSEGGAGRQFFENAGCDASSIEQILVENVEDAQIKILDTFNMIMEYKEKDPDAKFLCVLDSLGALVAAKVLRDAEKDKVVSEMGGRSKVVNNMMKALSIPALKSDTPMIVINHVYQNPGALFTSKIQSQGGGLGLQYMGTLNLQCSRCLEKDEDKDSEAYYGQTRLHFFTVKNRMVRPSLECDIWLDFKKGFVRQFESLFDEAVRGGFFINTKQGWYSCPYWDDPDKNFRKSYLISGQSKEIWKTFLDKFEEWSNTDLAYKALDQNLDEMEDEINDQIENGSIDDIEASEE